MRHWDTGFSMLHEIPEGLGFMAMGKLKLKMSSV